MPKANHDPKAPSRRLLSLFGASTLAFMACDTSIESRSASAQTQNAEAKHMIAAQRSSSVRVRVAGTESCGRCSLPELETLLGARARKPLPKDPLALPKDAQAYALGQNYRWSVKFLDSLEVRLSATKAPPAANLLPPQAGSAQTPNRGLPQLYSRRGGNLDSVEALRQRYQAQFVREIDSSDQELDALRERALRRSLVAQPDLAGLYWVDAAFESPEQMLRFGRELQALPEVEFVQLQPLNVPPPQDIPPKSSDLSGGQGYLGPDPGVNGLYAWKQGYFGEGVRISDCEYAWEIKHEDLTENPLEVEKGQSAASSNPDHGTAVMGIVVAGHNGYGVKGLAPKAKPAVYPEGPNRRTASVTNAIRDSSAGDIVMLEMQTYGRSQKQLVPAEYDKPVWMATKTGTDAGILVIAAAGNGYENLDIPFYKSYLDRGDSGAIIVGAGTANRNHSKMDFSTYGKRVDIQAWGEKVVTTGYGDLKTFGGDKRQKYTRVFAGTSSATPIASGAAALIQSFAKKEHGKFLTPIEMRKLLIDTGIPQKSGGRIGPMPNVKAAMEKLGNAEPDTEKPKVKITAPDKDIKVTLEKDESFHALKIEVEASDNKRVQAVHLEVDGKKVGDADKEAPYIFNVELEAGEYELVAVAIDPSDNEGRSKTLEAEILPFEEAGGGDTDDSTESKSDSENNSDSNSKSDDIPESDKSNSTADASESKSESESESDTDEDSDNAEDSDDEDSDDSNNQDKPDAPKPRGCALAESSPGPVTMALAFALLAGLRRKR